LPDDSKVKSTPRENLTNGRTSWKFGTLKIANRRRWVGKRTLGTSDYLPYLSLQAKATETVRFAYRKNPLKEVFRRASFRQQEKKREREQDWAGGFGRNQA